MELKEIDKATIETLEKEYNNSYKEILKNWREYEKEIETPEKVIKGSPGK